MAGDEEGLLNQLELVLSDLKENGFDIILKENRDNMALEIFLLVLRIFV